MKYIYVIISAMLLANIASARGTDVEFATSGGPGIGGGGGILPPHFGSGSNGAGARGEYRLVAKTSLKFHNGKFVPVDSVTYSFSNGRNGYTKKDDWNNDETVLFDESFTYFFNELQGDYDKKLKRAQTYYANNAINSVTYTTLQRDQLWRDSARFFYAYDGDGKMTSSVLETWQGSAWTVSEPSEIIYTGGVIAEMSTPSDKLELQYEKNKLISSVHFEKVIGGGNIWQLRGKTEYTYSGDDITATVEQVWNSTGNKWVNVSRIEYSYSGKSLIGTEELTWNGFSWAPLKKHHFTYDAKGNKETEVEQVWNSTAGNYVSTKRERCTYNAYNQPLVITTYTWDGINWISTDGDTELRFYYDFPTGVTEVSLDRNSLKAYPVPATNVLNLDINWSQPQDFTVTIIDMQGRVVRTWAELPQAQYHGSIAVGDLAAGGYFIKVAGEKEQLTERLIITR
jgi:hypothetical protein